MITNCQLANYLRAISLDMIENAGSGHPGAALGMADIISVLFTSHLKQSLKKTDWISRDRFILSNGHVSALLYSALYMSGYLDLEDLKRFRKLSSNTPGHPEYNVGHGISCTTGPLGQGLAMGVGMAVGETVLAKEFNRSDFSIIDNHTYVFVGDGCLMEGISHEACSLAGTLELGKLIVFWDNNNISIDGEIDAWFSEDVVARYKAYNWQLIEVDGHDAKAIDEAIILAKENTAQPSLIACKTVIGFSSDKFAGKSESHGSPLGADEVENIKFKLNGQSDKFFINKEIEAEWKRRISTFDTKYEKWSELLVGYKESNSKLYTNLLERLNTKALTKDILRLYDSIKNSVPTLDKLSTRKLSKYCLDLISEEYPALIGGSADLTSSCLSKAKKMESYSVDNRSGKHIHYGAREFAMQSMVNGLSLYGAFIPYSATFLSFIDYAKNALRLSAMMKLKTINILTHDSIGVGEDGPTHQAVEQLVSLRAIPGVYNFRPANLFECFVAWNFALNNSVVTNLILSRQDVTLHDSSEDLNLDDVHLGAYIFKKEEGNLKAIIIASGSELALVMDCLQEYNLPGIRVVSMLCMDLFLEQKASYKEKILPASCLARLAVEASGSMPWYQYVGLSGRIISQDTYGLSGEEKSVFDYYGFNKVNILTKLKELGVSCD